MLGILEVLEEEGCWRRTLEGGDVGGTGGGMLNDE